MTEPVVAVLCPGGVMAWALSEWAYWRWRASASAAARGWG